MKQKYYSPELEITLLMAEDILNSSLELDNEIEIPTDEDFWS